MNNEYGSAAVARARARRTTEFRFGDAHVPRLDRIVVQEPTHPSLELANLKRGLLAAEARIDPKYFYDPAGCALFDAICGLPEYYLTRTEAAILRRHRADILAALPAPLQWIDLGCGSGEKSIPWLESAQARRFIGVDIADAWLRDAVAGIATRFRGIDCSGVVADFSSRLAIHDVIAERPELRPVFFYPGSSLGNFSRDGALALLRAIHGHLDGGGALLIGVDLVKDARVLEAAYDDAAGVTAAFNRNILNVVNRLLDADFAPERFEHLAGFNRAERRIEMRLRSACAQIVNMAGERRIFGEGECILTEYSHKYTVGGFSRLLHAAGFVRHKAWTDPAGWFAVFLAEAG